MIMKLIHVKPRLELAGIIKDTKKDKITKNIIFAGLVAQSQYDAKHG